MHIVAKTFEIYFLAKISSYIHTAAATHFCICLLQSKMTEPKTVTLRYFDKESEDSTSSTWKCHGKVGNEPCERIIVRKAGAGWTNTFNHVKSFHPEWEQDSKQSQLAFTASPVENVYCWIDWVTTNLKPFYTQM